jgi:hypothetical protein
MPCWTCTRAGHEGTYEGCGDIFGEFLGNDGEAGGEERGVSHGFHYADQEGQYDEGVVLVNSVQQPASLPEI